MITICSDHDYHHDRYDHYYYDNEECGLVEANVEALSGAFNDKYDADDFDRTLRTITTILLRRYYPGVNHLQKSSWQGMKKLKETCLRCQVFLKLVLSSSSKTTS